MGETIEPHKEKSIGNKHIAYIIRHTLKNELFGMDGRTKEGRNPREEMQIQALGLLMALRHHPNYLQYPQAKTVQLSEIVGTLPDDPGIINLSLKDVRFNASDPRLVWTKKELFYEYARMARDPGNDFGSGVVVPEPDQMVTTGILTDVCRNTDEKLSVIMEESERYRSGFEFLARESNSTPDQIKRYILARKGYDLFTVGYLLPHIEAGTKAEEQVQEYIPQISEERLREAKKELKLI